MSGARPPRLFRFLPSACAGLPAAGLARYLALGCNRTLMRRFGAVASARGSSRRSDLSSERGSARSSDQQGVLLRLAARIVPLPPLGRDSQSQGPAEGLPELTEVRSGPQTSSELRYHARAPPPPRGVKGERRVALFLEQQRATGFSGSARSVCLYFDINIYLSETTNSLAPLLGRWKWLGLQPKS